MRALADSYAAEGFTALVPDMFWRLEPGLHMGYTPENSRHGLALYAKLDRAHAVEDVAQCLAFLRKRAESNGKIGVMGFCMGGEVALLAGCRLPVDAVAIYYGTRMEAHLEEMATLAPPTVMHFAALDPHVPMASVEAYKKKVAGQDHVAIYVYNEADHAFARLNHPQFHAAADALARQRTAQLFRRLKTS
jgi:carboxymethylenebutenolidase